MEKKWIILLAIIFAIGIMAFASARYYSTQELQKYDYDNEYGHMFEKRIENPDGSVTIKPPTVFLTRDTKKVLTKRLEDALREEREKQRMAERGITEEVEEKLTEKIYTIFGEKYLVSINIINGALQKAAEAVPKPITDVKVSVEAEKITSEEEQPAEIEEDYIQGPEEERSD